MKKTLSRVMAINFTIDETKAGSVMADLVSKYSVDNLDFNVVTKVPPGRNRPRDDGMTINKAVLAHLRTTKHAKRQEVVQALQKIGFVKSSVETGLTKLVTTGFLRRLATGKITLTKKGKDVGTD